MCLEQAIKTWDGKSSEDIKEIYRQYKDSDHFVAKIIEFAATKELQNGATWMLKRRFEEAYSAKGSEISELCKVFPKTAYWEARLHLLQCIPFINIPALLKKQFKSFLKSSLFDQNKFVRAWAYNGLYVLSRQYPEYQQETERLFANAMRDEAASVKARIRNVMKKGFNPPACDLKK